MRRGWKRAPIAAPASARPISRSPTSPRRILGPASVTRVLQGARDDVVRLPMTPGTLLIFEGRHSLHRVSPLRGATSRLVGLLAYDTKPGTVSTEILRLARYGRSA